MKSNYLFFAALCWASFIFGQNGKVKISGNILHPTAEEIVINSISERPIKNIKLNNGAFELAFEIKSGYYILRHGNETSNIYLHPNDNLIINLDAENFDESITYKGKGSHRNNYLARKVLINEKARKDVDSFYEGTEQVYFEKIKKLNETLKNELEKSDIEYFFMKDELKSLNYSLLLGIQNYERLQDYYFGKKIEVSSSFLSPLNRIDFDNDDEFNKQPYYNYLVSSKWKKEIENENGYTKMNKKLHSINSASIKTSLLISFYYSISNNIHKAEDYFKLIKNNTSSSQFITAAKEKLKTVLKIKKGVKSPSFTFKDIENKTYSLSDFKGKYVFIDVWATWCGPCLQQIPALKKLDHEYQNKDIVFVSISVDKVSAYDKWKKMVKEKALVGIQLFADNSFSSDFIKAYGISSIPRFIIIDKEGNIYDENADKPSTESTKKVLDDLLK